MEGLMGESNGYNNGWKVDKRSVEMLPERVNKGEKKLPGRWVQEIGKICGKWML